MSFLPFRLHFISCFHAKIHGFWVNFQTYANLGFLMIQVIFSEIDQSVFVLGCYELDLDGLI